MPPPELNSNGRRHVGYGGEAIEVLIEECDSAIERIKAHPGIEDCAGHGPLVSGVIVLLRCERAELQRKHALAQEWVALAQVREAEKRRAAEERAADKRRARAQLIVAICAGVFLANLPAIIGGSKAVLDRLAP